MTRSEERRRGKLKLYRRHLTECPHKQKGRAFDSCRCPIWIQGTWGGEAMRHSLGVDTWTAAEKIKRNIEDGVQEEKPKEEGITIKNALAAFIKDCEGRNLSRNTLRKYRTLETRLNDFVSEHDALRSLDKERVRSFRAAWKLSALSASKEIGHLRTFFVYCIDRGWLQENPTKTLKAPQIKIIPRLPFSETEIQNILSKAEDDRELAFLLTLRHTGLRIGDASLLRVSHLLENRLFLRTTKAGTPVSILIPDSLLNLLKKLPPKGGYLFLRGESVHPHTASDLWRKRIKAICKEVGIVPDHPHRFRHSLAADLLSKGVTVENVAAILGNSPAIVGRHYSQWIQSRQDALDVALQSTWKPALQVVKK